MQPFLLALANSPLLYVLALVLCTVGVVLLVRPTVTALYDPWAVQQIQTSFASAAVLFMGMAGVIKPSVLVYHVAATASFMLCAGLCFKVMIQNCLTARRVRPAALNSQRNIFLLLLVAAQLAAWGLTGIPLLLESRLDAFSSGGGVGVLSRIVSFTSFATVFLTVLRVGISPYKRLSRTDVFVLAFTVLASVANASKTNIVATLLLVLTSHWIFRHLIAGYAAPRVSRKRVIAMGVALALLVLVPVTVELSRDDNTNIGGPLEAIALRLIFSGDGYMWMYGDDYLSAVTVSSPTALLFADFLGVTRLVPWDQLPVHPGLQVFQILFPDSEAIRGPNMRVDLFGLLYGSMPFGVIFSALLGCTFGLLRAWLFRARSSLFFLPAAYIFFQSPTFLVDPLLGVTALVNTTVAMVIVAVALLFVGKDPFTSGRRMRLRRIKALLRAPTPSIPT